MAGTYELPKNGILGLHFIGLNFRCYVFSTTWPGLFSGSFSVRFFHSDVFSTTSPLRFSVRSGSFLGADPLFSIASPVRFSKKVFFFVFASVNPA
ncbi:MAG TPA: hypothetical protein VGW37_07145 [Terriglobia bacterium]|nr:hypothetical protein [Terriglobia bacterium]